MAVAKINKVVCVTMRSSSSFHELVALFWISDVLLTSSSSEFLTTEIA